MKCARLLVGVLAAIMSMGLGVSSGLAIDQNDLDKIATEIGGASDRLSARVGRIEADSRLSSEKKEALRANAEVVFVNEAVREVEQFDALVAASGGGGGLTGCPLPIQVGHIRRALICNHINPYTSPFGAQCC